MSYLEKLLDGVTVEWRPLSKSLVRTKGTSITAGQMKVLNKNNAPVKIFAGGKTVAYFNFNDLPEKDINREPSIIVKSRGVIEFEYYDKPFSHKNEMWSYHSINEYLSIKFVYYFLKINEPYFQNLGNRMQMPQISTPDTEKFEIPIPCPDNPKKSLEIQQKIVGILDSFTELKMELKMELIAELTARKMQYSYYREKSYSFDNNKVQHLPLGDENIGKFIRGGGLQKKDFTEPGVGCIHYGQIYTYYGTYTDKTKSFVSEEFAKKARMAKYGDLVIATTSENDEDVCKAVAWLGDKEIAVSSDACFYRHNLNPKYVAYFFQTEQFQKQKRSFITGTKVRRVNADDLAKIKIPVPSKEEQERVATILEKFEKLINSISEGLPKEIELRQKQYEYYRDLLLTFPKINIVE